MAKTNHYKNVLKQSIVLFVLIILFDYFLRLFLNSGMLSSTATFIVVVILSIVLITVGALSFSYFFMLNGIRRGAGIKNNLIVFIFSNTFIDVFLRLIFLWLAHFILRHMKMLKWSSKKME